MTDPITRCRKITAAILLLGCGSASVIYLNAGEVPLDRFAEFEKSKKFAYELERMGGKAALVANDFNRWLAGLWQGEALAYTVAVITLVIAAGYYFIATALAAEASWRPIEELPSATKQPAEKRHDQRDEDA